jgi:hypothetical protein
MPLVLAVRVVQLHPDLSYVVALPVQPQHLVTELSDASGHSFEFVAVRFTRPPLEFGLLAVDVCERGSVNCVLGKSACEKIDEKSYNF